MILALSGLDAFILGALGVSLPVIAHLMNRRTRRWVMFPSLQLLREATAQQSTLFRLRKWLLLMLRCAAVMLLAAAFARPVWTAARGDVDTSGGEAVVLVLDVSASSAQQSGGVTVAHHLRAAAEARLDALRPGVDSAAIVYADANPSAPFTRPVPNLDVLRGELDTLKPTQQRADLQGAITLAASVLESAKGARRIVVLSDMQQTNWAEVLIDQSTLGGSGNATRVEVQPVTPTGGATGNVALSRPAVSPAHPIAGRAARLSCSVWNYADKAATVTVSLAVDGREVASRPVTMQAWSQEAVTFETALATAGAHGVTFAITPDTMPVDDRVSLGVDVVERVPVVVIGDDDPAAPTGASYFLERALAPRRGADNDLEVRHLRGDAVTATALSGVEAVIVGDVGLLSDTAVTALRDYVASGGGLIWLCGDGPVGLNAGALRRAADGGLLPWQPLGVSSAGNDSTGVGFDGDAAWATAPLASFDALSEDALLRVRLGRVYDVGEVNDDAHTLLRLADAARTPALSTMGYRDGRVYMCNFSPSPRTGDLGKHGVFVALLHALVDAARTTNDTRRTAAVGRPLRIDIPYTALPDESAGRRFRTTGPDDQPVEPLVSTDDTGVTLTLPRPTAAGLYRVYVNGGATPVAIGAANVDARESDLRAMPTDSINDRITGIGVRVDVAGNAIDPGSADGRSTRRATGDEREGRPLWPWLIAAACVLLGVEMALIGWWRR
ncbi:MAG: VWA domain-containing protein [Phycisphaera sp.]|nr:VWA domain-containing protein [Phycisphaera sp.]